MNLSNSNVKQNINFQRLKPHVITDAATYCTLLHKYIEFTYKSEQKF